MQRGVTALLWAPAAADPIPATGPCRAAVLGACADPFPKGHFALGIPPGGLPVGDHCHRCRGCRRDRLQQPWRGDTEHQQRPTVPQALLSASPWPLASKGGSGQTPAQLRPPPLQERLPCGAGANPGVAGRSVGAAAGDIPSQAVLSYLSPEQVPTPLSQRAPSPGVPDAGGAAGAAGGPAAGRSCGCFSCLPLPRPGSRSFFQQVPVISGVITGVRFRAAKRGFWSGGEVAGSSGGGQRGAREGWSGVGASRIFVPFHLGSTLLRVEVLQQPSAHAVGCWLPVSGSAASPSQPYAAPAETGTTQPH